MSEEEITHVKRERKLEEGWNWKYWYNSEFSIYVKKSIEIKPVRTRVPWEGLGAAVPQEQ